MVFLEVKSAAGETFSGVLKIFTVGEKVKNKHWSKLYKFTVVQCHVTLIYVSLPIINPGIAKFNQSLGKTSFFIHHVYEYAPQHQRAKVAMVKLTIIARSALTFEKDK